MASVRGPRYTARQTSPPHDAVRDRTTPETSPMKRRERTPCHHAQAPRRCRPRRPSRSCAHQPPGRGRRIRTGRCASSRPSPGGAIDVLCRVIAEALATRPGTERGGRSAPGRFHNRGADIVAKAAPDGYTLLITTSATHLTNPVFFAKAALRRGARLHAHHPDFTGQRAAADFRQRALLRTQGIRCLGEAAEPPGQFRFLGVGTSGHLFGERLKKDFGLNLNHVALQGRPASLRRRAWRRARRCRSARPSAPRHWCAAAASRCSA